MYRKSKCFLHHTMIWKMRDRPSFDTLTTEELIKAREYFIKLINSSSPYKDTYQIEVDCIDYELNRRNNPRSKAGSD